MLGRKVSNLVLDYLNGIGNIGCTNNDTYIVLIPNINDPKKISEFRSISFCNVVCKLIPRLYKQTS